MREIIFRSWNETDQCFYYFTQGLYFDSLEFNNEVNAFCFKWTNAEEYSGKEDKNGVKIFEGDKIKHVNGQKRVNNEWVDNEEYFEVKFKHGALRPVEFFWSSDAIEVISNIHESLTPNK
ncbi:YopX family protein [Elizabethkingia anophelis]|uniref:YopX family protein n=1 Tax=Elizabethkingia anophelis TaxID=1117645 RepID=UPI0038922830